MINKCKAITTTSCTSILDSYPASTWPLPINTYLRHTGRVLYKQSIRSEDPGPFCIPSLSPQSSPILAPAAGASPDLRLWLRLSVNITTPSQQLARSLTRDRKVRGRCVILRLKAYLLLISLSSSLIHSPSNTRKYIFPISERYFGERKE